jgi:hypothetical protein
MLCEMEGLVIAAPRLTPSSDGMKRKECPSSLVRRMLLKY